MLSNIAIDIKNVSKFFNIYETPADRFKQFVFPPLQRLIGAQEQCYFSSFHALNDISFSVNKGETVGVVGRNGAGKSTLLQIICGTLHASSGDIHVRGRVAALLELGSGFNPDYTGKENVYLNAALLGLSRAEIDAKYEDILRFADIGVFIDQPLKTYSSGMVVRLAFAVSINVDPEILIIDEALSVGDELFQRKCFSKLEDIKKNGATILFVSHSGAAVVGLCDRAILIDDGEIILSGEPKKVVGLYQKLLYAQSSKRTVIRENIKNNRESFEYNNPAPDAVSGLEVTAYGEAGLQAVRETYDPNLVSSSLVEYASEGAVISDPHIFLDGFGRVNNLIMGGEYRYRYTVTFTKECFLVRFGMLIKTVSGIELGGATTSFSASKAIVCIEQGASYLVEFNFKCALTPGIYFLNAGASGDISGEIKYLHRLLDAAIFRVLPEKESLITGVVNFNIRSTVSLGG